MQHDELDTMLLRRAAPPSPRRNFAEDIIHAALTHPRARAQALTFWGEFTSMFAIPHPSVAVAAGIILGLVMGVQAGDGMTLLQQDWTSFLDINEGGWL